MIPTRKQIADYNKELNTQTKQAYKYILKPWIYKEEAFKLIDKGVTQGIITQQYANEKKLQFSKTFNSPSRAKQWLKDKLIQARDKLIKKKKFKGKILSPKEQEELNETDMIMEELNKHDSEEKETEV
jgi:hypothetical protein